METVSKDYFKTVMTTDKIKELIDALGLTFLVVTIGGNTTKEKFDTCLVMEHNFVSMSKIYNDGRRHTAKFNWPNGGMMSIERLTKLKEYLKAPEDAQIFLQFDRNSEADEYDDVAEFVWFRPYENFDEFYKDQKNNFDGLVHMVKRDMEIHRNIELKLQRKNAKNK